MAKNKTPIYKRLKEIETEKNNNIEKIINSFLLKKEDDSSSFEHRIFKFKRKKEENEVNKKVKKFPIQLNI